MFETIVNLKSKRHIWAAAMFSLIMPGLGQVYCGKLARGLVLNFLNILPLPIIIILFSQSNSPALMQITIALIFVGGIVQLIAVIDAAYFAKRSGTDYELKDYNRWYVYVLLVLIVTGGSIGSGLYLRDQTLEAFIVPAPSCYPSIVPGDRIFANKSAYRTDDPQRGDLVVFLNPENRRINFIKRVIAVAGDTIEIKDGQLYINNKILPRQMLPESILKNIKIKVEGELLYGDVFYEINGKAKYKIIKAKPPHDKKPADYAKIGKQKP